MDAQKEYTFITYATTPGEGEKSRSVCCVKSSMSGALSASEAAGAADNADSMYRCWEMAAHTTFSPNTGRTSGF